VNYLCLQNFFPGITAFILQRYLKKCFKSMLLGIFDYGGVRIQKILTVLNTYTIQRDSQVKTFSHFRIFVISNHEPLDFPCHNEASSSMSRNPFFAVPWNAEAFRRNPYVDAASNFVQSSFFRVFSPGRFPVLIVLSDSFHKGVLSIVTFELLNTGSVEKEGLLIMIMFNILSELTKNTT